MSSPSGTTHRFEADRVGMIVMYIVGIIVAAVGAPLIAVIAHQITTVPHMILVGAGAAVLAAIFAFVRMRQIGLEWIEFDDEGLTVCMKDQTHRFRWDQMTKVVQNYDPEEEWYIYTDSQRWALRFDPSNLSSKDLKAMRALFKEKIGYTSERDPAYVARHSK